MPPAAPPLYTPHLPLYSCLPPPNTNPENSAKPNSQCHPDEGLRPPTPFHNCHLTSEERRTQLRCAVPGTPPPAVPRLRHTALRDTRSPLQPSHRPPAHHPPPRQTHTPTGPASGIVTCSLKSPSRSPLRSGPGHQLPRAGFSEPVNLTLTPPDGSVPQARLHRGGKNKNVRKERRITAVGKVQSCDRRGASDPASSSAPIPPRPPRPAGSPGTEGGCSLSRRQTSPRPRGRARTHTHTHSHAAAATDTIGRRRTEGQREDTPRVPPGAATAAASGPEPPPGATLPTSAEYSQNSCKFGRFLNQCSKCGLQNKRERNHARSLASSLRVGIQHMTAATARLQREPGSNRAPPSPHTKRAPLLPGAPGLRLPYRQGTRLIRGKPGEGARSQSAVPDRGGDAGWARTPGCPGRRVGGGGRGVGG